MKRNWKKIAQLKHEKPDFFKILVNYNQSSSLYEGLVDGSPEYYLNSLIEEQMPLSKQELLNVVEVIEKEFVIINLLKELEISYKDFNLLGECDKEEKSLPRVIGNIFSLYKNPLVSFIASSLQRGEEAVIQGEEFVVVFNSIKPLLFPEGLSNSFSEENNKKCRELIRHSLILVPKKSLLTV